MKETAYLLQAALICIWWVGLATNQAFFAKFQYDEIPSIAFWAFVAPDVILIAALSTVRAYRKLCMLDYVILGAFGYAALYCVNATFLTGSGYLPTAAMLLGLGYNLFLCFNQSLFRNAAASFTCNLVKTLIQIVCVWTLSLVVIPFILLDAFETLPIPSLGLSSYLGSIGFACCSALGLASAYIMVRDGEGTPLPLDQTNRLVVTGPYRYVRNPMAVAGIGQGLALALIFQSASILIYSLLGALVWHLVVRPVEEGDMVQRFGNSYLEYRKHVSCWIPTFGKHTT